jgi:CRP/FNR family transcriptional regulator, cyclic AMP receptor protein
MSTKRPAEAAPNNESEARDLMGRIGWLSRTPESFRMNVLRRSRLLRIDTGQPVYKLDDPPGGIYGLVSGGVAVTIAPQEHGPYFAHVMGVGAWFGLAAAMNRHSRTVGLITTRPSSLLLLPMAEFDTLVAEDPGVWRYFAVLALINSNIAMSAVDDLLIRDPARRCVAGLLRLAGLRNSTGLSPVLHEVDVTQEELAHLSNLSRNATGSVLRDMQKRGFLELAYKSIRILNAAALLAFVQDGDKV